MVSRNAEEEYQRSRTITAPLAAIIAHKGDTLPDTDFEKESRNSAARTKRDRNRDRNAQIIGQLPTRIQKNIDQAKEPGGLIFVGGYLQPFYNFNSQKNLGGGNVLTTLVVCMIPQVSRKILV